VNLADILAGAHVALRLIQARLITLIALLLGAVLYGWAMWQQTWLGFTIATVWGLSIFLPILLVGRGGYDGWSASKRPQRGGQPEEGEPDAADRT
jgi:hypothetical protein